MECQYCGEEFSIDNVTEYTSEHHLQTKGLRFISANKFKRKEWVIKKKN